MPRTILKVTTVWALAIASLTACTAGNETPSKAAASTVPTTATASSTPSASPAKQYSKADLDAALLAGPDLPAGYVVDRQMSSGDAATSSCTDEAIALDGYRRDAKVTTGTAFSKPSGELVIQSLTLMSGEVDNNTLAALKKAVARCTTWTIDKSTYTLVQADYGPYSDESFSYRVTVVSEVPVVFAMVFMRKANLLMAVQVAAVGNSAPKDAKTIFDNAARKLSAL